IADIKNADWSVWNQSGLLIGTDRIDAVVGFLPGQEGFVAESIGKGETRPDLELILEEYAMEIGVVVRIADAETDTGAVEQAQHKVGGRVAGGGSAEGEVWCSQKCLAELQMKPFITEFHLVAATRPTDDVFGLPVGAVEESRSAAAKGEIAAHADRHG